MQAMLHGFASALAAFLTGVSDLGGRVTVVTISEFGRRAGENGGGGLDNGWGNMMLLAGGGVRRGYHGIWPGLDATRHSRFDSRASGHGVSRPGKGD